MSIKNFPNTFSFTKNNTQFLSSTHFIHVTKVLIIQRRNPFEPAIHS